MSKRKKRGFSLIEVVLAIGIFMITVLALVGLIGPTLESVNEIEVADQIPTVVNAVNAFLQNSTEIGGLTGTKFISIFNAVVHENEATIFVYRYASTNGTRTEVGFSPSESSRVGASSIVNEPVGTNPASFNAADGEIFRVVLSVSSATPSSYRSGSRSAGVYTLQNPTSYDLGYFAMEVRIFAEDPPGPTGTYNTATVLADLETVEPDFTYNTAIVR